MNLIEKYTKEPITEQKYYTEDKTYTFDIIGEMEKVTIPMWFGRCRENGKEAWLDLNGIQFADENHRFEASTKPLAPTPKTFIFYAWDNDEDTLPTTKFFKTKKEAEAFGKQYYEEYGVAGVIYEAKPI